MKQCSRVCGEKMVGLATEANVAIAPCAQKVAAVAENSVNAAGDAAAEYMRKTVSAVNETIELVKNLFRRKQVHKGGANASASASLGKLTRPCMLDVDRLLSIVVRVGNSDQHSMT